MEKYVRRVEYLDFLKSAKDLPHVVKVITGMRRCGKSTLLNQYMSDLHAEGIKEENILFINFETLFGQSFNDSVELNEYLYDKVHGKKNMYVFLDEIQNVKNWELSVAALCAEGNCDTYITGSNSNMLSSDLSTHLSGRYVEVPMLPLSFREFIALREVSADDVSLNQYLRFGALPDTDPVRGELYCHSYLEGVFNTVLVKDIMQRIKTDDVNRIWAIARFLYSNIGNECSTHSIAVSTKLSEETVQKYIDAMCDAMLFYKVEKYDIVGKKLLTTRKKYYASDLGLRNAMLMGAEGSDMSRPLENIVFLELKRRGYIVRSGSYRDSEVDFTAYRNDSVEYFQVTQTMLQEETRSREFRSLSRINDDHRKTILTMDRIGLGQEKGIRIVNIVDWLCDGDSK